MTSEHNKEWFSLRQLRESKRNLTSLGQEPASWQVENLKTNCEGVIEELTRTNKESGYSDWMARSILEHHISSVENILISLRRTYPQNFI